MYDITCLEFRGGTKKIMLDKELITKVANFIVLLVFIFLVACSYNPALSQTTLKGGIRAIIKKGEEIKVSINTPINFYFSQAGDTVTAITKEDIVVENEIYIPKGSRIEGTITDIKEPKHLGVGGSFEIDFNKIITPNDISIPIYVSVTTDTSSRIEKVASILSYDSALIAYGTFHGALGGIQIGGIPLLIASHGLSTAFGAGVGAGFGIIGSLARKGLTPIVLSGQYIPLALKSNLFILGELGDIEARSKDAKENSYTGFRYYPPAKKEEIELAIKNIKKEHSKTYGSYLVIEFNLKNNSRKNISLSDIVLANENETTRLHADIFLSGTEALKTIKPFDEIITSLAFLTSDKKEDYSLIIIDPLDNVEIVRVPLKITSD